MTLTHDRIKEIAKDVVKTSFFKYFLCRNPRIAIYLGEYLRRDELRESSEGGITQNQPSSMQ